MFLSLWVNNGPKGPPTWPLFPVNMLHKLVHPSWQVWQNYYFFFLLNSDKCCLISIRMNFCSSDKGLLSYWDCLNPATGSFVNSITPCNGLNKYSAWVLVEKEIFWRKVEVKDRKQWWNFKDAFNSLYTFMHIYTAFRKYIQSNIH